MLQTLRLALRDPDPVSFLMTVSGLLSVVDPRHRTSLAPQGTPQEAVPTLSNLVDSFIGVNFAETTAVLHVMNALLEDESERTRIAFELTQRRQPVPEWIRALADARVNPTVTELTDIQGDGDDYFIEVSLPSGESLTALIYVDHNLGTVVKDAFVASIPIQEFLTRVESTLDGSGQSLLEVDASLARATVEQAIAHGAMLWPPFETETWPMCRPLIEWMLRMLPGGGVAPELHEWTEAELAEIAAGFWESDFATGVDRRDGPNILDSLLWFGSSYTACDPWRWSSVNVEMLLTDWFPRKVIADTEYLSGMPDVLRAFIRYCHHERGIPASRTVETLAAVDHWEPEYQQAIRSSRMQGAHALAASLLDDDVYGDDYGFDDISDSEILLRWLDDAVGGRAALMSLGTEPLPDEEFIWAGIPADIHEVVETVLNECDRVADQLLDAEGGHEYRTAIRRLLSRVAVADPMIFRRKASPIRGAAALSWIILRANEYRAATVTDLMAAFGLTGSPSQRAQPMLKAIGVDPYLQYADIRLGSVDFLTSARRANIIRRRDWAIEL